jgi:hypothetical protein
LASDESGGLERTELLQDAGPARADRDRELVRGRRPVAPKMKQDLAPQGAGRRRSLGSVRSRSDANGVGTGRIHR